MSSALVEKLCKLLSFWVGFPSKGQKSGLKEHDMTWWSICMGTVIKYGGWGKKLVTNIAHNSKNIQGHWYPYFGLHVISALGFKVRVDPFLVWNGFLSFTSGLTPADLLMASMAVEPFWSTYLEQALVWLQPWNSVLNRMNIFQQFSFQNISNRKHQNSLNYISRCKNEMLLCV